MFTDLLSRPQAGTDPALPYETDDARYQAIRDRDPAADGAFFYSVATTGVYCRPSCAARLPRRENVGFHADRAGARQAGFRACKRCRPDEPPLAERRAALAAQACRLIEAAADDTPPSLAELAAAVGLSPHHFHRLFRAATGVTPKEYVAAQRARRLRAGLAAGDSVTAAIYEAGYGSSSRFYEQADATLGMTATDFRKGGAGVRIWYRIAACSLGLVMVAATERGICAILFGENDGGLLGDLRLRFPKAELVAPPETFADWVAMVVDFVDQPRRGLELPLDIQGTAFQQRVWRALREIPAGETRSYREIAADLGEPQAMRAVAGACAANKLAVAVPCHRVVRSDGDLSGYRWGVPRKRALLDRETAAKNSA